jgi:hypothetical protein
MTTPAPRTIWNVVAQQGDLTKVSAIIKTVTDFFPPNRTLFAVHDNGFIENPDYGEQAKTYPNGFFATYTALGVYPVRVYYKIFFQNMYFFLLSFGWQSCRFSNCTVCLCLSVNF